MRVHSRISSSLVVCRKHTAVLSVEIGILVVHKCLGSIVAVALVCDVKRLFHIALLLFWLAGQAVYFCVQFTSVRDGRFVFFQ